MGLQPVGLRDRTAQHEGLKALHVSWGSKKRGIVAVLGFMMETLLQNLDSGAGCL